MIKTVNLTYLNEEAIEQVVTPVAGKQRLKQIVKSSFKPSLTINQKYELLINSFCQNYITYVRNQNF